jgi:hypothetical protein
VTAEVAVLRVEDADALGLLKVERVGDCLCDLVGVDVRGKERDPEAGDIAALIDADIGEVDWDGRLQTAPAGGCLLPVSCGHVGSFRFGSTPASCRAQAPHKS